MNPAFIYFDLDDTLLDHKKAEEAALRDVHDHFDFFANTEPEKLIRIYHDINKRLWERYGHGSIDRMQLQRLRFENSLDDLTLDNSRYAEVGQYYMQCYHSHWRWIDGAREALERIVKKYDTGIITNGFSEIQEAKFDFFSLRDKVKHLIISEEIGVMKPNPGIFEYATRLAGCDKKDILYVGDSFSSDIEGGYGYGWHTAWYTHDTNGHSTVHADLVFNNFEILCDELGV